MRGNLNEVIGDWGDLDSTAVDVALQSARRVHFKFAEYSELGDLESEAFALILSGEDHQRAIENEDWGYLQHQLELDLMDLLDKEVRRTKKNVSLDGLLEQAERNDGTDNTGYLVSSVIIETASNDYSRDSVESLLPAVWDESYVYGLPKKDTAPDPDMPKGTTNKAHANNLAAYIADIKFGWEKAPLSDKERAALLLAYGFGWTQEQIAFNQGVTQPSINERLDRAVGKVVARLNGGYYYDSEEAKAA